MQGMIYNIYIASLYYDVSMMPCINKILTSNTNTNTIVYHGAFIYVCYEEEEATLSPPSPLHMFFSKSKEFDRFGVRCRVRR